MKKRYEEKESYKHKLAKELLAGWLIDAERIARGETCRLAQFAWRKSCGVHVELKFYDNSSPYYFEQAPRRNGKIIFVPDITVFHQGHAHLIFEIVHKSPLSFDKEFTMQSFFHNHYVQIYSISADYLLNQIKIPSVISAKRHLELWETKITSSSMIIMPDPTRNSGGSSGTMAA